MPNDKKVSITVENVSKTFGQAGEAVHALKEVSFEVYHGELVMIVGPSGCGKTTLLSSIAATLSFDSGEITVLDKKLSTLSEQEKTVFRKESIGFIFQQYHLIPTLSASENASIPLLLKGTKRHQAFLRAEQVLDSVGLASKVHRRPKELSGGQQQRVAIARALVHDPKLVICDEPTAALDHETGIKILDILKKISENPERSVLVVTHDFRIFKYADRIIEMDDGKVRAIRSAA